MPINSRQKGARGEREWASFLIERGYRAERGKQFQGGHDSPDVKCPELHPIVWEVKRVEQVSINNWVRQAIEDAGGDGIGIVAHRRNGEEWKVTMDAKTFFEKFLRPWLALRETNMDIRHGQA